MKRLAWLAYGLALLIGGAVLAIAGGASGLWQMLDHALYRQLAGEAEPAPAPGIHVIDLHQTGAAGDGERAAPFRLRVGEVLRILAAGARVPQVVVLDIWFAAGSSGAEAVVDGIAALQARGVRVVGAVNLIERHGRRSRDPLSYHDARIYRHGLDAFGHAELRYRYGVLSYEREVPIRAGDLVTESLPALPLVAVMDPARVPSLPDALVVPIGDDRVFDGRLTRIEISGQPLGAAERQRLAAAGAATQVIVGSLAADSDNVLGRPGPLLMAWAMSDLLAGRSSEHRTPLNRPEVAALLALAAALCAGLAAIGAFQALRARVAPPRWYRLALACLLLGAGAGLALLLTAQAIALSSAKVLPVAWPAACALLAALIATLANRRWIDDARVRLQQQRSDGERAIQHDVFVSYAHDPAENREWVRDRIVRPLGRLTGPDGRRLRIFFDEQSIDVGRAWKREIELALLGSRCVVPVYSDRYFDRPYCREEIELADQLRIEGRLELIPVARVTDGIPERYLRKVQYLDASGGRDVTEPLLARVRQVVGGAAEPVAAAGAVPEAGR
ncbi:MAG: toll/interleukin-1 receptor domain-containing protein [Lautropia sp.]